jgi:hypothetical protein
VEKEQNYFSQVELKIKCVSFLSKAGKENIRVNNNYNFVEVHHLGVLVPKFMNHQYIKLIKH